MVVMTRWCGGSEGGAWWWHGLMVGMMEVRGVVSLGWCRSAGRDGGDVVMVLVCAGGWDGWRWPEVAPKNLRLGGVCICVARLNEKP
ncbi:hypothetical protein Tco_0463171 [Tanacetum coccineum]